MQSHRAGKVSFEAEKHRKRWRWARVHNVVGTEEVEKASCIGAICHMEYPMTVVGIALAFSWTILGTRRRGQLLEIKDFDSRP